jgi:hypothetical protein
MSCKAWLLRLATLNRNRDNTQVSSLSRGFSAAASLYARGSVAFLGPCNCIAIDLSESVGICVSRTWGLAWGARGRGGARRFFLSEHFYGLW